MADQYKVKCQTCGKERVVSRATVYLIEKMGQSLNCRSCSSLNNKRRYFGNPYDRSLYQTPIYQSWYNMKTRCLNKKSPNYQGYGSRGISVCDKWLTFGGFIEDMKGSYREGLTIERINNNSNYCKENCRWATRAEQARNTRNIEKAAKYTFNGKTKTIREWAEDTGIKRTTLDMRLRHYKWPISKALGGIF